MAAATRFLASAAVGGLMVAGASLPLRAQSAERSPVPPVLYAASSASGSIVGVVQDERGRPLGGVVVSALGATTTVAVTDKTGRFEFGTLAPGPYSIRAHHSGYVSPRTQSVHVNPSARVASTVTLRRAGAFAPVLAAGIATLQDDAAAGSAPDDPEPSTASAEPAGDADRDEVAWRIRHARRAVLKDVAVPQEFLIADESADVSTGHGGGPGSSAPVAFLGRVLSPARAATSFLVDTPFSGQVNLLTAGSFDAPNQLFSNSTLSRSITYLRLGAPVGDHGDWTASGALNRSDISSWIVAGSYTTRAQARHRSDVGMAYSTQRYDGGNLLALRDVADGSRNAGTVYGYDSFAVSPALTLAYGGAYARYDYLHNQNLLSPRAELTVAPIEGLRLTAVVGRRALAPGAEEFLPPGDTGIWLPPQRTFSSLRADGQFQAERTTHVEVEIERDFSASTVAFKVFRQHVDDQLVTLFGTDVPGQPAAKIGHYVVGNAGDADASGCVAAFRTVIARRVYGSVEYTVANARMTPDAQLRYLVLLEPSAVRATPDRIQSLTTAIETTVPETATRVLVFYRLGNAFADPSSSGEDSGRGGFDTRFDVQVRQSLPFMNFTSARWEMLFAVRNFFREQAPEQSVYDELLVIRPPKRVVGGVTLRF